MDLEQQIKIDGIDHASTRIAQVINEKTINSHEVALQFILEELDAARQGNDVAIGFVKSSGIEESKYIGAMNNSFDEVDGSTGPQQMLLQFVMMINDMDLRVKLRVAIVDKIMQEWNVGRYEKKGVDAGLTKQQINNTSIVSITQSGKLLFTGAEILSRDKDSLEGRVLEVMIIFPDHEPYFVYYINTDYYNSMSMGFGLGTPRQMMEAQENRDKLSIKVGTLLGDWLLVNKGINTNGVSYNYSHNYINTNTIVFVDSLKDWYPIRDASDEPEGAIKIKVDRINSGMDNILDHVSISELSPRYLH